MDAHVDVPTSPTTPAVVADLLANGDQQMPSETRHQMEATKKEEKNSHKDDRKDQSKEGGERTAREIHGAGGEMEKMQLDFERTLLKHQHEENDKQRQHPPKTDPMRHQSPSRRQARWEEEQIDTKLDPITEIELEKMRMEFELAKLKHIAEENERQRQHERKICEDKEKQRQHEEKMEQLYQRQRSLRVVSQKSAKDKAEVAAETFSEAFGEGGKMRVELQLAMEVSLPEKGEKNPVCEQSGLQGSLELKQQGEKTLVVGKDQAPQEQKNDGVTEHLGLQVPCIMVSGAQPEWSSSRLDLAIENELEKRRMEFELIRLKYEHEENERQRQHEEKMEQLRQQGALKEEDNPENASSAADNATEGTSAPDDLTEPPCTPNDATDPLDIRDEEGHVGMKPQVELDHLPRAGLTIIEGEVDGWGQVEQSNKQARELATQLEKMRLEMELIMARYQNDDKEKQRQHEEKMEQMRRQAPMSVQASGGHGRLFLPQDQFTLFLYCFIFIHVIYVTKELMFFLIKENEMYVIGAILAICVLKMFCK